MGYVTSQMCVPVTVAGLVILVRQKLLLMLVVLSSNQVFTAKSVFSIQEGDNDYSISSNH